MRIGIDARLATKERTGIGSYTAHLIQAFAEIAAEHEFILFSDESVPEAGPNFRGSVIGVRRRMLWTAAFLPFALRSLRPDLYHGTANFELPAAAGCPLVCTVHDLIPLHFPELVSRRFHFLFRSLIGPALRRATRVITDSRFSRDDILSRFPLSPDKVVVIPLAAHPRFGTDRDRAAAGRLREKYGLGERYVLFVGVFEPRKNIPFLVEAYMRYRSRRSADGAVQLALAGGRGHRGDEIVRAVKRMDGGSEVRLLGYVPDEDLPHLYREADLVVVPSQYEGFGLPALEAMACGTPVLASDTSSLPEVVGEAGALFTPGDPALLARLLGELLADEERLAQMSEKGALRARDFSWEKTARRTLEVYASVCAEGGGRP